MKFAGNRIKTAFDSIINISRVKPTFYTQYQNYSLKCSLKLCFQKSIQALLYNYLAESYDCILLYMAESCDCILLYMAMSCDYTVVYGNVMWLYNVVYGNVMWLYCCIWQSCDCILLYKYTYSSISIKHWLLTCDSVNNNKCDWYIYFVCFLHLNISHSHNNPCVSSCKLIKKCCLK